MSDYPEDLILENFTRGDKRKINEIHGWLEKSGVVVSQNQITGNIEVNGIPTLIPRCFDCERRDVAEKSSVRTTHSDTPGRAEDRNKPGMVGKEKISKNSINPAEAAIQLGLHPPSSDVLSTIGLLANCSYRLGQINERLDEVARTIETGKPNLTPDEIVSLLGYIKTGIR